MLDTYGIPAIQAFQTCIRQKSEKNGFLPNVFPVRVYVLMRTDPKSQTKQR